MIPKTKPFYMVHEILEGEPCAPQLFKSKKAARFIFDQYVNENDPEHFVIDSEDTEKGILDHAESKGYSVYLYEVIPR